MGFLVGEQTAWIQNRTLRTETRNLKIQDGKDVNVRTSTQELLGRPVEDLIFVENTKFR